VTHDDDELEDLDDDEDDPTGVAYGELTAAFAHFNIDLFDGRLPPCLITLQRKRGAYGYFSFGRFKRADGDEPVHEIALNPTAWRKRSVEVNLSTLVHEMCHLEQYCFGKPGRGRYHNREWARMMLAVGLISSTTGQPGGRQTGDSVTHYIEPSGRFEKACAEFLALGYKLSFHDLTNEKDGVERRYKTKFTCPGCGANAWGKLDLHIDCRDCGQPMGRMAFP